jgi:hypothetical protein
MNQFNNGGGDDDCREEESGGTRQVRVGRALRLPCPWHLPSRPQEGPPSHPLQISRMATSDLTSTSG